MYDSSSTKFDIPVRKGVTGVIVGLLSVGLALGSSAAIPDAANAAEIPAVKISEATTPASQDDWRVR